MSASRAPGSTDSKKVDSTRLKYSFLNILKWLLYEV